MADPVRLLHHLVNAWLTYSYHSYQSEIFPTHIRARAVGFCYSFSRLSTVFSSIIIGIILQYGGSLGVIAFIVASMLIVMLVIGLFGENARYRSGKHLTFCAGGDAGLFSKKLAIMRKLFRYHCLCACRTVTRYKIQFNTERGTRHEHPHRARWRAHFL